jgi:hypothetical protein
VGLTVVLVEEQQEESKLSLHCVADLSVHLEHDETQLKQIWHEKYVSINQTQT